MVTGIYMYITNEKGVSYLYPILYIHMIDIIWVFNNEQEPRIFLIGIISPVPKEQYNNVLRYH